MVDLNTSEKTKSKKGVPPLVWIVLALVAGWIAFTVLGSNNHRVTPSGETMPQPRAEETYMPAAPARDGAPPVEGRTVETP
ncbi:MAG: hypothetical protein Q7V15_06670 [Phenylobacterium sp.]|uniref:hypothetical protein n=1 Tax=Phenylobacterium sp. TaxID=1871053 RepID=UPI00271D1F01|nr:hypothetical protein [Phenylobacterium sp.]MDO8901019.1 hypothetical protein [Phenylobacterium sp.]